MAREKNDFNGQDEPRTSLAAREDISARAIDLDNEEEEQFLRTERRVAVRRSALPRKAQKRVTRALAIVAVVAVFGGAAVATYSYGMHAARFRIDSSDNIEVHGVQNAPRAQIMDVAGDDIGRNIFYVPLDERRKQLEQIPWVESASVMRLLPNRIAIQIKERTPIAFVQIGSKISLIDANGVVMGLAASKHSKYSFPVIRGISETEPRSSRAAAMKIYSRLISELDSQEGVHYSQQVSEVDLSDPEDVKITTNDPSGAVLIHLGTSDFLTRYKWYIANIADWRQKYSNVQSVDLRYDGQIVVNPDGSRPAPTSGSGKRVPAAAHRRR